MGGQTSANQPQVPPWLAPYAIEGAPPGVAAFSFAAPAATAAVAATAAAAAEARELAERQAATRAARKATYAAPASPLITLRDGTLMPAVGLGTWKAAAGEVWAAVAAALRAGYRHIDCAEVGRAGPVTAWGFPSCAAPSMLCKHARFAQHCAAQHKHQSACGQPSCLLSTKSPSMLCKPYSLAGKTCLGLLSRLCPQACSAACWPPAVTALPALLCSVQVYQNEEEVGEALGRVLEDGLVPRQELYIVSKVWCAITRCCKRGLGKCVGNARPCI